MRWRRPQPASACVARSASPTSPPSLSAVNITAGKPVAKPAGRPARDEGDPDYGEGLGARRRRLRAAAAEQPLRGDDGADDEGGGWADAGLSWLEIVDNWHIRAFTSFGEGQGVWEKDGGAQLPFYARNMTRG